MHKKILTAVALMFCLSASLQGEWQNPVNQGSIKAAPKKILINNRPLIKINGQTISLMDVVKKMDLFILEKYPQLMSSMPERFKFYSQNWLASLRDMIETELFLAEAESKNIKVSDGDIREEVYERFGPNVMPRLDALNLSYDEACELSKKELITRKIRNFKIYSKAFQGITPAKIKAKYEEYVAANPPKEEWEYQVVSLRSKDKDQKSLQTYAQKFSDLLSNSCHAIDQAIISLKNSEPNISESVSHNVSEKMKGDEITISGSHKAILQSLEENSYSNPIRQMSRQDNSMVYRIFYLISKNKKMPRNFQDMYEDIKNRLISEAIDRETKMYVQYLQKKYGLDEENLGAIFSQNFQPFSLVLNE